MKNYTWKDFRPEAPVPCFKCNRFIYEDGKRLFVNGKINLNFHKKCSETVDKLIQAGFRFILPRPFVLLGRKMSKNFKVKKQEFQKDDMIILDHNWKLKGVSKQEFLESFTSVDKVDE